MDTGGVHTGARGNRPPAFVPFSAKLVPPVATIPLIDRPRLVDDLLGFEGRVVVISAPAGYGKSILAAQWLAADPRPGAWLSLDPADNDPHVLLTYLALAAGESAEHGLAVDAPLDDVLVLLRSTVCDRTEPIVLVLDDAHVVTGDSVKVLATLAEHFPAGSVLVAVTREPAPFPTARGIPRGDVKVIGAADLAMTLDEADALLHSHGMGESQTMAEVLHDATEGWAAALYLAALALRGADDPVAGAQTFGGRHRPIVDLFAEEVLPAIAPEDLDFLLATAVLDRCSGDLCDTALERDGSGAMLERLARTNRFVIPLDAHGEWYRYHHLFAEMLLAEARTRDPARVARVALRASQWWEDRFDPDAAVALAQLARNRDRVLELIARWSPPLLSDRRRATVDNWLAAFTEDEIFSTPTLAQSAAWSALLSGDAAGVHRFAAVLEATSPDHVLHDGTPPRASADLFRALTTPSGLTEMRDAAASARASLPFGGVYRSVASLLEAHARALLGDVDGAVSAAEETITIGRMQVVSSLAHGLAVRGRLEAMMGDWAAAAASVREAVAIAEEHWFDERPAFAPSYATAALVLARAGRPARAIRERAIALVRRLDDVMPFLSAGATIEIAESALLEGEIDLAGELLADAERRLRRLRDTGLLPFALERVGDAIARESARGVVTMVEPLSPAELRVLAYLPTHLTINEIAAELFVSRNTVKSHAMAIYRKLGVASRSEAVRDATNLGLLGSSGLGRTG